MVAEGTFREDLFYRINVFPIHIPPLRERRDDIPALAFHFLKQFSEELEQPVPQFSDGAMSLLMNYDWPGNVRELENTVHRAVILTSDNVIRQAHLANILDTAPRSDLDVPRTSDDLKRVKKIAREKSVEDIEKLFVLETLKRNVWNVTKSAEETGMQRANFQALMKKYNIRVRDTEPPGSGERTAERGAAARPRSASAGVDAASAWRIGSASPGRTSRADFPAVGQEDQRRPQLDAGRTGPAAGRCRPPPSGAATSGMRGQRLRRSMAVPRGTSRTRACRTPAPPARPAHRPRPGKVPFQQMPCSCCDCPKPGRAA